MYTQPATRPINTVAEWSTMPQDPVTATNPDELKDLWQGAMSVRRTSTSEKLPVLHII
jgi:hypothetical protein